ELLAHDLGASHRAPKYGLVEDHPHVWPDLTLEYRLPFHALCREFWSVGPVVGGEDGARVVLGLKQATDKQHAPNAVGRRPLFVFKVLPETWWEDVLDLNFVDQLPEAMEVAVRLEVGVEVVCGLLRDLA